MFSRFAVAVCTFTLAFAAMALAASTPENMKRQDLGSIVNSLTSDAAGAFSTATNGAASVFSEATSGAASAFSQATSGGASVGGDITSVGKDIATKITSIGGNAATIITSAGGAAITLASSGAANVFTTSFGDNLYTAISDNNSPSAAYAVSPQLAFGVAAVISSMFLGALVVL
ncbi:helix-turn-helix transcription factor, AraC type [Cristinia sonorae]|uniref:Helix-turn-helix transcription factor, AraC type n=1 Tax=Cristinia sonorae TaxID=1940300 RepID=A0A8K0XUH6_9AGAR|nr:helix-turn-helix transcription factor, AraC type [Cristinia sonorae]